MSKTIFIGNEFLDSNIKSMIKDPYTNKNIKEISLATSSQAKKAITFAQRALIITKHEPSFVRKKRLLKLALDIAKNKEVFAQLIAIEAAKPIRLARAEVERALMTIKEAAEETTRLDGEFLDFESDKASRGTKGIVKYEAKGIIYAISPFNFPLNLMMHKLAPALALGAPIIIKPPKQTPLTAIKLAEILQELDFPRGLVQILPSDNAVAKEIMEDENIQVVSFTGSQEVGDIIQKIAYNKKVLLELGGIGTMVVDQTANLELAAKRAAIGAFAYSGQICIAVQRVLVQEDIYARFKELFLKETEAIISGNPLDEQALLSVMIDEDAVKKFHRFYHDAIVKRADVLLEPNIEGQLVSPAIIESDEDNLLLNKEEAFAPIVLLRKYKHLEEAIGIVNSNKYGLQASLFSDSLTSIERVIEGFEVGGVIINDYPTFRVDKQPYGGIKASGQGREGVKYAMREFANVKTIIFRTHKG